MSAVDDPVLAAALLTDAAGFGVRPPDQPVPPHLGKGALARAFFRWVRMRDDAGQASAKAAMSTALAHLDEADIERLARQQSALARPAGWDHWIWATSSGTMAGLLGLGPRDLVAQRVLVARLHAIAKGLAPEATADQVAAADAACTELMDKVANTSTLRLGLPNPDDDLANRFALLWQSFDAGAALLGKAIVALSKDASLRRAGTMKDWLPNMVRQDGILLNTRRFARADGRIGDQTVRRGDTIVVTLRHHGFGHGPHQCPGKDVALTVAATALEDVLGERNLAWPTEHKILALPNANIPYWKERPR